MFKPMNIGSKLVRIIKSVKNVAKSDSLVHVSDTTELVSAVSMTVLSYRLRGVNDSAELKSRGVNDTEEFLHIRISPRN